jgi:alkylated DNA repair dioxygenase AlkB
MLRLKKNLEQPQLGSNRTMEFLGQLGVLFKLYRDNNDSVARHRDRGNELDNRPVIGSVSFL